MAQCSLGNLAVHGCKLKIRFSSHVNDIEPSTDTLERELSRLSISVSKAGAGRTGSAAQAVKAICTLLGAVETMQISRSLAHLISACSQVMACIPYNV